MGIMSAFIFLYSFILYVNSCTVYSDPRIVIVIVTRFIAVSQFYRYSIDVL